MWVATVIPGGAIKGVHQRAPWGPRPEVDDPDFVVVSSDLRPYVLDTRVKRGAELSTRSPPGGELAPLAEEEVGQTWQTQTYCEEGLLGTNVWPSPLSGSSKLWTQGLWCLSWWQSPNPVVDTGSKGCRQAEEGVPIGPCWPVGLLTQLTGRYRQASKPSSPEGGPGGKNSGLGGVRKQEAGDSEVDSSITQAEVTEVVHKLLGGKAPGVDEIRPEYLKSLDVVGLSWLTRLCNIAWRLGTVPLEWQTGVVVPLFKKGDRRVCSNYRGITLLSLPGKVYTPGYWRGEFAAYSRPLDSGGTMRFLNVLVVEQWTSSIPSTGCWRVYGSCLPNQSTCALWIWRRHSTVSLVVFCGECSMRVWGPGAFAKGCLVSVTTGAGAWTIRIAGSKSDLFPVHVGLRQGCPLSPVLFIIFMDRISRRSQGPEGVRFGNHRISSLLFADDVVLLASSSQDLQHVLERFAAECEAAGMRISTSKSEAMVLDRKRVACPLRVGGEVLPQVEEFKYLGVLFTRVRRKDGA
ncbi:hypothetical protein L3Q82_009217 [Scortum barcoo]|uniref:Uncharacterized protein n=1 Tax=Scortum barcoo TaxID=214431 RepID=A0ACB8WF58_9TELE|nr:hypothetical protein L3Q82_009217 [Scortum barcoo]